MTDFSNFDSRICYEMEGWVFEDINTDRFTRASEAQAVSETELRFDEQLFANIINLDGWLHADWSERMAHEFDIGDGRTFEPDWDEVTVRLDVFQSELIKAAETRADEDHTEAVYVLASWVYLAEKADHIQSYRPLEGAYEQLANREDQPDDSTTDNYEGKK